MISKNIILIFLSLIISCGEEEDRQEVVDKLRGFGISLNKSIFSIDNIKSTSEIEFTAHVLSNDDKKITAQNYDDSLSKNFFIIPNIEITETQDPEKIGSLYLSKIKAKIAIPQIVRDSISEDLLDQLNGSAKIRYGISLTNSIRTENMVADFLVVKNDSEGLKWIPPEVSITKPSSSEITLDTKEIEVEASLSNKNDEDYKIHWFISGGKIENFRAKTSKWELPEKGEHTLIIGVYGTKSRTFAFASKAITIK